MTQGPLPDVSHKAYVTLLAHYQPRDAKRGTGILAEVAEVMADRLVVERISRNVYRMLPPDSVFSAAKASPVVANYIPSKLPPREVENCKFKLPASAHSSTVPRSQFLGRRREMYGDWQLTTSLLPEHQSA